MEKIAFIKSIKRNLKKCECVENSHSLHRADKLTAEIEKKMHKVHMDNAAVPQNEAVKWNESKW